MLFVAVFKMQSATLENTRFTRYNAKRSRNTPPQQAKYAGGVRMTNEEIAERIYAGGTELYSALWDNLKRYIYRLCNAYYKRHRERLTACGVIFLFSMSRLISQYLLQSHQAIWKSYGGKILLSFLHYYFYRHIAS